MPSQLHEVLVALLREHPESAVTLLKRALGLDLGPEIRPRTSAESLSEIEPAEYRADAVIELFSGDSEAPVGAVVVEVQLRPDPKKRLSWPLYIAGVRARLRCPVELVVLTPSSSVASWCGEAIELDLRGRSVVRPSVVGPANLPVVTEEAEAAQQPELAVLSVIAHGHGKNGAAIGRAALKAFAGLDEERAALYVDLVFLHLPQAVRTALESLMDTKEYEYQSEFAQKYVAQGELSRAAASVLTVLEARGLAVTPEVRARIEECHELDVLQHWLVSAATVTATEEIFES